MAKDYGPFIEEYLDDNGIRHRMTRHWSMGVEDWKTGLLIASMELDHRGAKAGRDWQVKQMKDEHYSKMMGAYLSDIYEGVKALQ